VPRKPRLEIAGGIHHVTSRGNRRQLVFQNDADRRLFLAELEQAMIRHRWSCLAYCLMDNHFHLVVETPLPNLGRGMRDFLSRFVQAFNRRHDTDGRMFKERFHSVVVTGDRHFACLLRYVALNPVHAGFCSDPAEWRWSSHRQMAAGHESPLTACARVEELLDCWGGRAGARYIRLLSDGGTFGRWDEATDPRPPRAAIADLLATMPREDAIRSARERHGYSIAEIAAEAGVSPATVSRCTRR
jgi:REP element-mobilizing transposase RayT